MMKTIFAISKLTFREAARRKILWAAFLLGILDLIVYGLGFYFIDQDIERSMGQGGISQVAISQVKNFMLMTGLYAVNFLTIAMAVLTSVDTIAGEISSGTMQTLVTKPAASLGSIDGQMDWFCHHDDALSLDDGWRYNGDCLWHHWIQRTKCYCRFRFIMDECFALIERFIFWGIISFYTGERCVGIWTVWRSLHWRLDRTTWLAFE